MRSTERDDGDNTVLGRAVDVLTAFTSADGPLSLAELSRRTGIPKATVHRLAAQLCDRGLLERSASGLRLGLRLFELGQLVPTQRGLREAALPHMNDLLEATRETVHLAVLDGTEVLYLEKLTGRRGPALPSRPGGRMPAYCTGVGKALLAFSPSETVAAVVDAGLCRVTPYTVVHPARLHRELTDIRRSGIAFEREESALGVICVACPVLGADGQVVAAVSISGWSNRLDTTRVAPAVRTATLAISRQFRVGPPASPDSSRLRR